MQGQGATGQCLLIGETRTAPRDPCSRGGARGRRTPRAGRGGSLGYKPRGESNTWAPGALAGEAQQTEAGSGLAPNTLLKAIKNHTGALSRNTMTRLCFIQIPPAASGRKKPEGKYGMWKGDKAGATTPIQAGSAEALKALKHMMGGRGRVRRTLGGGLTGAEREGSLKGNSQLPCMGTREEDASRHRERGPCRRGFGNALHSLPPARVNWVSLLCTSHCPFCLLN